MRLILILIIYSLSKMTFALSSNSFVVANLLGEDAYMYAVASKDHDKPKVRKTPIKKWGLYESIEKYLHEKINAAVSEDDIAFDKINVIPSRSDIYQELSIDNARQVLPGGIPNQPGKGMFLQNIYLTKNNLEKLALYGKKHGADTVVAVYPAKGHYPIKKVGLNRFLFATPPGVAFVYAENEINSAISLWLFLIDVKTKRTLAMQPGFSFDKIKFPTRVLTQHEIEELNKWIEVKGKIDFSKPISKSEMERIISMDSDSEEDNSYEIMQRLKPLHHTIDKFDKLPPAIIDIMKEGLIKSAIESLELANIVYLLKETYTAGD